MKKNLQKICSYFMYMAVLFLVSLTAQGENVVSGKVTDSKDGTPLQGVTVLVKGTATSTQTQGDGSFTLTAPSGSGTLVISSVGFAQQEVPNQQKILLTLHRAV